MKFLVFGSTGFIGKHLVQKLAENGYQVLGLSSKQLDITQTKQFSQLDNDYDCVINMAAYVPYDKFKDIDRKCLLVNALGTANILKFAQKANIPFIIHSSSASVYGMAKKIPVREKDPLNPINAYAISKLAAESYCQIYQELYGLKIIILRYGSVYGKGCNQNTVLPLFSKLAKKNKQIKIKGNGSRSQDFVYINDVISANMQAIKSKQSGIYNIGSGKETTMKELAETTVKVFSSTSEISYRMDKGVAENLRIQLDISKAKKYLGYRPKYSLSRGLKEYSKTL